MRAATDSGHAAADAACQPSGSYVAYPAYARGQSTCSGLPGTRRARLKRDDVRARAFRSSIAQAHRSSQVDVTQPSGGGPAVLRGFHVKTSISQANTAPVREVGASVTAVLSVTLSDRRLLKMTTSCWIRRPSRPKKLPSVPYRPPRSKRGRHHPQRLLLRCG